tara:strand:- start:2438 stop:2881 length:444 start_codon:yes stop_codon:yes gene_type:complete
MTAIINIYGKSKWATKISSMFLPGECKQYDITDYDTAPGYLSWIIAEEDGSTRKDIATSYLSTETFITLFKGLDDLIDVKVGVGLIVGFGSLVRPGTVIGDHVYIGAGTIIDIDCTIGNYVTIEDGVIITAGSIIEDGAIIKSGTII